MSSIKIEFSIFSDADFDFDKITQIIGCKPTKSYTKGTLIRKNLYTKEYAWILGIKGKKVYELDGLFHDLLSQINNREALSDLVLQSNLSVKFDIVVSDIIDTIPSLFITKEAINDCSLLNAEIDIDVLL